VAPLPLREGRRKKRLTWLGFGLGSISLGLHLKFSLILFNLGALGFEGFGFFPPKFKGVKICG